MRYRVKIPAVLVILLLFFAINSHGQNPRENVDFAKKFPHLSLGSGQFEPLSEKPITLDSEPATNWKNIFIQTSLFLTLQTGWRLVEQERTRSELAGPFFRDWFRSVRVDGWGDGNKFITNWIAHPAKGSVAAFVFHQNNRQSLEAEFGWNREYFRAKINQTMFAFVESELSEFGPLSEASMGNVGMLGKSGLIDHVVTPLVGVGAWSVAEDAIDKYFLRSILEKPGKRRKILTSILNPTRSLANILSFKAPWHRDN